MSTFRFLVLVHCIAWSGRKKFCFCAYSLPLLLDMFGNQSSTVDELMEFIVQYLKAFDPADPYWKV